MISNSRSIIAVVSDRLVIPSSDSFKRRNVDSGTVMSRKSADIIHRIISFTVFALNLNSLAYSSNSVAYASKRT
jgi:hypothetical protein